jgi:hypothetical protein
MGPCTGNVRFGIPCDNANHINNSRYCVDLSIMSGLATIPIMSSSDKANTFVGCADPTAAVSGGTIFLAELGAY